MFIRIERKKKRFSLRLSVGIEESVSNDNFIRYLRGYWALNAVG